MIIKTTVSCLFTSRADGDDGQGLQGQTRGVLLNGIQSMTSYDVVAMTGTSAVTEFAKRLASEEVKKIFAETGIS